MIIAVSDQITQAHWVEMGKRLTDPHMSAIKQTPVRKGSSFHSAARQLGV